MITAAKWAALDLALRRGKQTMRHTAYQQRLERLAELPEVPDPRALAAWREALRRDDATDPHSAGSAGDARPSRPRGALEAA